MSAHVLGFFSRVLASFSFSTYAGEGTPLGAPTGKSTPRVAGSRESVRDLLAVVDGKSMDLVPLIARSNTTQSQNWVNGDV